MKFKVIATIMMVVMLMVADGLMFYILALLFAVAALLIWVVPPPRAAPGDRSPEPGFQAAFEHDYIALDTTNRRLWIRDPKRGQRYLEPEDIITIQTGLENVARGRVHQHLEIQINDLEHPVWYVWFDRHPESRIKGSNRNTQERDEWFARIKTWAGMKNVR